MEDMDQFDHCWGTKAVQGDPSGWLKHPVDLVLTVPAVTVATYHPGSMANPKSK